MILSIYSGSNSPEPTNVLMGTIVNSFSLDVTQFTPAQKGVYDAFFNAIGSYTSVNVLNAPVNMDLTHVTPNTVSQEWVDIDYSTLAAAEKKAVDDMVALVTSLIDTEIFYPPVENSSEEEQPIEN
jgi:hypothetical protein